MAKKKFSERQMRSRRAAKLRDKAKNGRALTADERDWLASYEAEKAASTAARAEAAKEAPTDEGTESAGEPEGAPTLEANPGEPAVSDGGDADSGDVGEPAVTSAPPPPPKAPPLPRPPRIDGEREREPKRGKGGDWRAKYETEDGDGREVTCKVIADQWHGFLRIMADQIKASGVDPIINPDDLYGSMMLTVDEFLPENMKLSPRTRALAGSTAILAHRFVRRKEIAEVLNKQQARKDHEAWQADRMRAKEKAEQAATVESATAHAPASPAPSSTPIVPSEASTTPDANGSAAAIDAITERIARERAAANGAATEVDERPLY